MQLWGDLVCGQALGEEVAAMVDQHVDQKVAEQTVVLPGSESTRWLDERALKTAPPAAAPVELTLLVRRQAELPDGLIEGPAVITRDELSDRYGADPADLARVEQVLGRLGLKVTSADAVSRLVTVEGPLSLLTEVFGTGVTLFESEDPFGPAPVRYTRHDGQLRLPAELDGVVLSIFGLDTQPSARPEFHMLTGRPQIVYTPLELAGLYDFPGDADGTGQTLAVISLGGGYRRQDLEAYFSDLGLAHPQISNVSVDGADVNADVATPTKFDLEVTLDLQIAGALAPGARIVNYFTHNTGPGIVKALEAAIHAPTTPTVISLSWGSPEETYSGQLGNAMNELFADAAALGITVCAATGDCGSGCGLHDGGSHVNFPASSPYVLACGGTTLIADPASNTIHSETTWNSGSGSATGGGVSGIFDLPVWQAGADVPNRFGKDEKGRGLPDVAANADTMTGYQILLNGKSGCIGGTSAATPLWAALICRLVQALGRPVGLLQPLIYHDQKPGQVTAGFRDVVAGDNGAYGARPGWDPNTGLGSPDGQALLATLRERVAAGSN
jgi:kumamolisin